MSSLFYQKPKLTGFRIHKVNLRQTFKRLGLKEHHVLKCVVQPDTHCPDEDPVAVNCFKMFLRDYKPHMYINLGDFLENEPSSHWPSNSAKARRLVPEAKYARGVLDDILDSAGRQCKERYFIMGNHEDWTQQMLVAKIPEIYEGLDEVGIDLSVPKMLGLKELGFKIVPVNEFLRVGYAHFFHGLYTTSNHPAKHLVVLGVNGYYGHLHDMLACQAVSMEGVREAMSLGCLRKLNAPFLKGKPTNWCHGWGIGNRE